MLRKRRFEDRYSVCKSIPGELCSFKTVFNPEGEKKTSLLFPPNPYLNPFP